MIALIQRVSSASVWVADAEVATINGGLLALIGIEKADTATNAARLQQKLLNYRVFPDETGRMNRNVREVGGGLLLVSQFTLAANTAKGNRPGFDPAMPLFRPLLRGNAGTVCARRLWRIRRRNAGTTGKRRTGNLLVTDLNSSSLPIYMQLSARCVCKSGNHPPLPHHYAARSPPSPPPLRRTPGTARALHAAFTYS